jgi:hypothetical protein
MTWHLDDALISGWVSGTDGSVVGASVEQHLLGCADCRARVPRPADLDDTWLRIRDELEAPRPSWVERGLARIGVPDADARVIAVSPAFQAAWLTGLAVILTFVVLAALWGDTRGQWLFVMVAPLVPAAGVAIGYDPETEPGLEQECATPYSRARMVLLRSLALIGTGIPLVVGLSLLLPGDISFLWLVPAATLTAAVLAASTWTAPLPAASALGFAWLVVVLSLSRGYAPEEVLKSGFLLAYFALGLASLVVVVVRRGRFGELVGGAR